jgi:hypothetical protein
VAVQIVVNINSANKCKQKPEGGQLEAFKERNLVETACEDELKEIGNANSAIESAPLKFSVNKQMKPTESGSEWNK